MTGFVQIGGHAVNPDEVACISPERAILDEPRSRVLFRSGQAIVVHGDVPDVMGRLTQGYRFRTEAACVDWRDVPPQPIRDQGEWDQIMQGFNSRAADRCGFSWRLTPREEERKFCREFGPHLEHRSGDGRSWVAVGHEASAMGAAWTA